MPQQPAGLGWLPDGRLLIVSMRDRAVLRREPDGTLARHADLSGHATGHTNDMVVDSHGRAFVGNFGFDLMAGDPLEPTSLAMPELSLPAGPTLCRYCGTPWQEQGSVFCVGCGMRVGSRPAPPESESEGKACASCGQQNQQAGTLCVQCGERVR